jgi:hypothetical protein
MLVRSRSCSRCGPTRADRRRCPRTDDDAPRGPPAGAAARDLSPAGVIPALLAAQASFAVMVG